MTISNKTKNNSNLEIDELLNSQIFLIWVPQSYGGLGYSLTSGLAELQKLAEKNGSLAWMVTLCAGANYFSRNLKPEVAELLFKSRKVCFGGSGMVAGTAEKHGDNYLIKGKWKYATGSIYLTHFTFNAKITLNGIPLLDSNGQEQISSFIIPKEFVKITKDWTSMGMKETQTHTFEIDNHYVSSDFCFTYNKFYTATVLDRIPFQIFTDLTFIVNYLGMAKHYLKLAEIELKNSNLTHPLEQSTSEIEQKISMFISKTENTIENNSKFINSLASEIHQYGTDLVKLLSHQIIDLYLNLGLKASQEDQELNKVFKDFFTATQHLNFRENKS